MNFKLIAAIPLFAAILLLAMDLCSSGVDKSYPRGLSAGMSRRSETQSMKKAESLRLA